MLFGANGSDIKVDSDAAFDINGNSRCSLYHYVINGGTARNDGNAIGGSYAQLGGRKISRNTPVISWTAATAPDATVKFIRADEGRRLTFIKKDDGLYVLSGFMIIVE